MFNTKEAEQIIRDGKLLLQYLFHFHEVRNTRFQFESRFAADMKSIEQIWLYLQQYAVQTSRWNPETRIKEIVPATNDVPRACSILELCPDITLVDRRLDGHGRTLYTVETISHDLNWIRSEFFK